MTVITIDAPTYFDQLARAEAVHWWHAAMWRITTGWLDRAHPGRSDLVALDVGCGSGGTMRRLADRPQIGRVIGIDPSRQALAIASGESKAGPTPKLRAMSCPTTLNLGSVLALPVASGTIDVATCFDVLQHLPPAADLVAMTELRRVLRPGGIAIIRANGAGLWPDPSRADQPYRLRTLVDLARAADLVVRRATYVNCLPAVATELLGRVRGTSRYGHPQGGGLRIRPRHPLANRVMGAIAVAEAFAVLRLRARLPVGHSTMMLVEAPGGTTS